MSGNQHSTQQPSRALAPRTVAAIVIGAAVATFVCTGGLGGLVYLYWPSAQDALEQANLMPRGLPLAFNRNAWMTQRVLGDVYNSSLAAVVADEQVVEHLGEPIETDVAAAEMYRRATSSSKLASEETIEYDLIGPKARATVSVTAKGASSTHPAMPGGPLQIETIKVNVDDGTVLEVQPAAPQ